MFGDPIEVEAPEGRQELSVMTFEDLDDLIPSDLVEQQDAPLRQIRPTSEKVTRSDSWWMTCPDPEGFTARAEAERQRMSSDPEARRVTDQIMGQFITSARRRE